MQSIKRVYAHKALSSVFYLFEVYLVVLIELYYTCVAFVDRRTTRKELAYSGTELARRNSQYLIKQTSRKTDRLPLTLAVGLQVIFLSSMLDVCLREK